MLAAWLPRRVWHRTASGTRVTPEALAMRDEAEVRDQYEFLIEQLESDDMRHEGVRRMFTYYRRALGWVLEEEHI